LEDFTIDGGPSNESNCPGNCGNLTNWLTYGDTEHYGQPSSTAGLDWDSGSDPALCVRVEKVFDFATSWDSSRYAYALLGPNSNTFARYAGLAAGFYPSAPPSAPGWDYVLP
jgi:hypothetical protein